jgi:hypothetical protein
MKPEIDGDWILQTLAAQGVASDAGRAQGYAATLSQLLAGAGPGYARIAFEEEPSGYVAEQRRNAP